MDEILQKGIVEPLRQLQQQVVNYLPNLFAVLFIVVVGVVVAWLAKEIVYRVLSLVRFDRLCERLGVATVIEPLGPRSSSYFAGRLVQGFLLLVTFVLALNALMPEVSADLTVRFLLYLPRILAAAIILLVGALVGRFLGRGTLIAAVNAGIAGARLLAGAVRFFILILSAVIALEMLGIGRATLVMTFGILFGGIVTALAIAFGIAGKDLAREVLDSVLKREPRAGETEGVRHV